MMKQGLLILVLLNLADFSYASTITISANVNSPVALADGIGGATTSGADMASLGLLALIHFSDGSDSGLVNWVTNVGTCTSAGGCGQASGAIGNGTWTLSESGNTGSVSDLANPNGTALNPWILTNTSTDLAIVSVDLIGGAFIAFDRNNFTSGEVGTPGSSFGIDYTFASEAGANSPFTVVVTYNGILQLQGAGAGAACTGAFYGGLTTTTGCGDEWGALGFAFIGGTPFQATAAGNAVWSFFQDTDSITQAAPIPEPASLSLLGLGLVGMLARRRARKHSNSD